MIRTTSSGEQNLNRAESLIRRRFVPELVPSLNCGLGSKALFPFASARKSLCVATSSGHCWAAVPPRGRLRNAEPERPRSDPMTIHPKTNEPPGGPLVLSGRDVTAVLGPDQHRQDPSRHRAHGGAWQRADRPAAQAAGARGLRPRLSRRSARQNVALITGEEKIVPPGARYSVCTVEALPRETDAAFVAIDEVQLAGDLERGHIFTDRILHLRGREETLLLGAATMRGILERLLEGHLGGHPAASLASRLCRPEEAHPPAAAAPPSSPSPPTRSMRSPS